MNSASTAHLRNSSLSHQTSNKPNKQSLSSSNSRHHLRPRYARVTSLFLGLATIISVIVGVVFLLDKNEFTLKREVQQNDNFQGIVSMASLQEHKVPEDCWLGIHGNVYDLTNYALEHPGGPEYITDFCGMDATRDYDIEHSRSLLRLVEGNLLGTLQEAEEETPEPTVADSTAVLTTTSPTSAPSNKPSDTLSAVPSQEITQSPTMRPTSAPSLAPTTQRTPVATVTSTPTGSSAQDVAEPLETETPTMLSATSLPTSEPTLMLERPSEAPTLFPTSKLPTSRPTAAPTLRPTPQPTPQPTPSPTKAAPVCTEQFYTNRDVASHASADDCWYTL